MKRHGFTLVEVFAAVVVLAACAVLFAGLVSLTVSERSQERLRRTAIDQTQNILARLADVPTEKILAGDFDKSVAEALIERSLPDGKIVFDTKTIESDNVVFTLTVSWSDGEKRPRREVAMFRVLNVSL